MRYLLLIATFIALFSCSSSNNTPLTGAQLYSKNCSACHQMNGMGVGNVFPPLVNSDYLMEDPNRAIHNILYGLTGEITVNDQKYNGLMAPLRLTDAEIISVVNYILKDFNQSSHKITKEDILSVRNKVKKSN